MKKIFTLIAGALLSLSVNAQSEKYEIAEGFTPTDNQKVQATASVELEFGKDGSWKESAKPGDTDPKFTDGFPCFVVGNGNPKSSNNKNFTPGNAATLPVTGTTYTFKAKQSGTLEVAVKLNSGKQFYIASSDGMNYSGSAVLTNTEGTTVELDGSFKVAAAFTGFVKFDILADETYVVFCSGSKLSFFGFIFTPGTVTEDEGTPHEAAAWDFTSKLSQTDIDNIKADNNWEIVETKDEETGEIKSINYKYIQKIEGVAASANGQELQLTKGLRFQTGAGKFEYYDGERLTFGGNGHGPIIPECGKGDIVKIIYKVGEAGRGFEVGNLELTDGKIIGDEKGTFEATFTVKKKGDVSFSSVAGADLLALSINKELTTAIKTVKNNALNVIAPAYNLAGQKVGKDFKGLVIKNGVKVVIK